LLERIVDAFALVRRDLDGIDAVLPGGDLFGEFTEFDRAFDRSQIVKRVASPSIAKQVKYLVVRDFRTVLLELSLRLLPSVATEKRV
jgi:hypothetical protein